MIKIEIPDSDLEFWYEIYTKKAEENKQQRSLLDQKELTTAQMLQSLVTRREKLNGTVVKAIKAETRKYTPRQKASFTDFNNAMRWEDKVAFVLKEENKPLTGKEILPILLGLQPSLTETRNAEQIQQSIWSTLSSNSKGKKGRFIKQSGDGKEYLYALNLKYKA